MSCIWCRITFHIKNKHLHFCTTSLLTIYALRSTSYHHAIFYLSHSSLFLLFRLGQPLFGGLEPYIVFLNLTFKLNWLFKWKLAHQEEIFVFFPMMYQLLSIFTFLFFEICIEIVKPNYFGMGSGTPTFLRRGYTVQM